MISKRKWVEDNSENESKTDAKTFTAGQPQRKTEPCPLMCVVVLISCVWEGLDEVCFWPTSISFDLHWELSHFKSNSPAQSTCVYVYIFGWMCKHMQLCVSSHASFYTGVCVYWCLIVAVFVFECLCVYLRVHMCTQAGTCIRCQTAVSWHCCSPAVCVYGCWQCGR